MAYQFYTVRKDGHVEALPIAIYAPDDATPVAEAKKRLDGHDIEVRQGSRVVAYLVPDNPANPK
jgi:hypothetical protein